jgi:hypothetical protein
VRYRPWVRTNGIYEITKRGVKSGAKGDQPLITQTPRGEVCILVTGRRGTRVRTYVEINRFTYKRQLAFHQIKNGTTNNQARSKG